MLMAARSCMLIAWLGFLAAGWHLAHTQSATFDEVPHLAAGVLYLSGDLRFNREHPPLATAQQGLTVMKLIDAIYESSEANKEVAIDI